ncbi:hypothetical protein GALL_407060 [mine drainage metagenome]|uniref:Uncharacterized protein n=1 Tax=mine drainage metagenome TaxID=410659 RepID=A0A1J5QJC5_9ZZZZ
MGGPQSLFGTHDIGTQQQHFGGQAGCQRTVQVLLIEPRTQLQVELGITQQKIYPVMGHRELVVVAGQAGLGRFQQTAGLLVFKVSGRPGLLPFLNQQKRVLTQRHVGLLGGHEFLVLQQGQIRHGHIGHQRQINRPARLLRCQIAQTCGIGQVRHAPPKIHFIRHARHVQIKAPAGQGCPNAAQVRRRAGHIARAHDIERWPQISTRYAKLGTCLENTPCGNAQVAVIGKRNTDELLQLRVGKEYLPACFGGCGTEVIRSLRPMFGHWQRRAHKISGLGTPHQKHHSN